MSSDRKTFIAGVTGSLVAATAIPSKAMASTGSSLGLSVSAYAASSKIASASTTDSLVLNSNSNFTQWSGYNTSRTVSGSGSISGSKYGATIAINNFTAPGVRYSGTIQKKISSNNRECQVTASGTTVSYGINSNNTASGTATTPKYKLNLSSQGLFNASGEATGYHMTVSGSLNGSFTTTFNRPIAKRASAVAAEGVISPEYLLYSTDPYGFYASAFDDAGLIMLLIPGLEPFGIGAGIIGAAIGTWGTFAGFNEF